MGCHSAELKEKDVISTRDGRRLGYITEFEIDVACGKILAIFVSPACGCFGFASPKVEVRIPWDKIECIGEDTVLVTPGDWCKECESCQLNRRKKKGGWFF